MRVRVARKTCGLRGAETHSYAVGATFNRSTPPPRSQGRTPTKRLYFLIPLHV
jgi:hypothetical protein